MIKAIEIKKLEKKYIVSHEKEAMIRHILPRFLSIKKYEEFQALEDINLDVNKSECLGLIGRNGAGKSTLLNIIAGITFPTQGLVKVNGKISAILSLGAGFHSDLTGEENIYLNASILGLQLKDIKERFQDIVEFSELKNFIDVPLHTYSAGMYMRLGFSIAVHVDFDILLIDEILSIGDIGFQEKCLNKLKEFHKEGKTLVFVSQSPDLFKGLCDRTVLLEKGKIEFMGRPDDTINRYQDLMQKRFIDKQSDFENLILVSQLGYFSNREAKQILTGWHTKYGNQEVQITKVRFLDGRGKEKNIFRTGENMTVKVDFITHKEIENPHFGVALFKEEGIYCYGPNTKFDGIRIKKLKKGRGEFLVEYFDLPLLSGKYASSVVIWENEERFPYDCHYAFYNFEIFNNNFKNEGLLYLPCIWKPSIEKLDVRNTERKEPNNFIKDFIDNNWQRTFDSEDIRIKEIRVMDRWHTVKRIFKTGEKIIFSIDFRSDKEIREPVIWVGLFGEDKLYYHGIRATIKKIRKGKSNFSIIYPKLNLLPRFHPLISSSARKFILSFSIFLNSQENFNKLCYGFYEFNIVSDREDHGIVFIKHRWNLNLPK